MPVRQFDHALIRRLWAQGVRKSEIARRVGCSFTTVTLVIAGRESRYAQLPTDELRRLYHHHAEKARAIRAEITRRKEQDAWAAHHSSHRRSA